MKSCNPTAPSNCTSHVILMIIEDTRFHGRNDHPMTTVSVLLRSAWHGRIGVLIIRLNYNTAGACTWTLAKIRRIAGESNALNVKMTRRRVSSSRLFRNLSTASDFRRAAVRERDVCQYVSYNAQSQLLLLIMCRIQVQAHEQAMNRTRRRLVRKGRCTLAQTHSFAYMHALIHVHVGDRRRLKRSPTSIALAINAPSALGLVFLFIPRGTRDSALSTCASLSALSSTPFSHYSANVSGCYVFFFWCRGKSVLLHAAVFWSFIRDFRFRISLTRTVSFPIRCSFARFVRLSRCMQKLLRRRSLN